MSETLSTDFTHRTHRAGGFLLMLAGVIGAIVGLGMLVSAAAAGGMLNISPTITATVGGVVLVFSVIEFVGGWAGYKGSNWYGSMTAAVLGIVTLFTLPLDLIGSILIALGEGHFDRTEE
ncbi:MAG: hypothetical protein ABEI06_03565 [Halobacteriaceae archaeon]